MIWQAFIIGSLIAAGASAGSLSVRAKNQYYFSSQSVTFPQAWAYCKNANMNFISLPTAAQNQALADALAALGSPSTTFWVGGIYLRNGFLNKWYWVDGQEDVNYLNWASSPVLNAAIDYCLVYSYNSATKKGVWTYSSCTVARYFICV